jgi:hypothetical protein
MKETTTVRNERTDRIIIAQVVEQSPPGKIGERIEKTEADILKLFSKMILPQSEENIVGPNKEKEFPIKDNEILLLKVVTQGTPDLIPGTNKTSSFQENGWKKFGYRTTVLVGNDTIEDAIFYVYSDSKKNLKKPNLVVKTEQANSTLCNELRSFPRTVALRK